MSKKYKNLFPYYNMKKFYGVPMNIEKIVEKQVNKLIRLSPPIEAFGIGGSFAHGTYDTMSDVDFFILYPSNSFFKYLVDFPNIISHTSSIVVKSGPTFHDGFGFTFSYVLDNGAWLEYHLNCRETLSVNPMRLDTKIIHDRDGFYTQFLETISLDYKILMDRLPAQATHDYLTRLLKIRKSIYRHELFMLLYNIHKLRRILIALDRHLLLGKPYSPAYAEKRVTEELGDKYLIELKPTVANLDYKSFLKAFTTIRQRILKSFHSLEPHPALSPIFYQLEQNFYKKIIGELNKCIS